MIALKLLAYKLFYFTALRAVEPMQSQLTALAKHITATTPLISPIHVYAFKRSLNKITPLNTPRITTSIFIPAKTVDGLWMLVHQGALQQLAWFKEIGDVQLMRQAALDELAHRALHGDK